MKKFSKILIAVLLIVACVTLVVGCNGGKPTKEDIAYKMIVTVADDYNEDLSNIRLVSGRLVENEESGEFTAHFKVSVSGYTMYFYGTYYTESGEIEYIDMTRTINSSPLGAGPAYLDTESFNITKVNNRLK